MDSPTFFVEVSFPALAIPRLERRVYGSIDGSSRPERDFPCILELDRAGRLPLDRLVSHRLPLEAVGDAFRLMREGKALRVVLQLHAMRRPEGSSAAHEEPAGSRRSPNARSGSVDGGVPG